MHGVKVFESKSKFDSSVTLYVLHDFGQNVNTKLLLVRFVYVSKVECSNIMVELKKFNNDILRKHALSRNFYF